MLYKINDREYELSDQSEFTCLLDVLCDHYHNKEAALISDSEYDGLAAEYQNLFGISYCDYHIKQVNDNDKTISNKGITTKTFKNETNKIEVDLPFFMPSLSKITDGDELLKWLDKMEGRSLMLTDKMDGIGCEIVYDLSLLTDVDLDDRRHGCVFLTRGSARDTSGKRGRRMNYVRNAAKQAIVLRHKEVAQFNQSHPLQIRAIRGELILTESNYRILQSRYPDKEYKNSRAAAIGIVNATVNIVDEDIALLDFVAFRVYCGGNLSEDPNNQQQAPSPTQEEEYELLLKLGFLRPTPMMVKKDLFHKKRDNFYGWLENELERRRQTGDYDLDGLCLYAITPGTHHQPNRPTDEIRKPDHERAVKFLGETAITTVTFVEWNPTKGGIFYPRIHFNPVQIIDKNDNAKCAGYSARHIKNECIGPGAKITVKKGGGILPIYVNCLQPAPNGPQFPDQEKQGRWTWDSNEVQLMIDEKEDNEEVLVKKITMFFKQYQNFGAKGLGAAKARLLLNEFGSLKQILLQGTKKERLSRLPKFQEKTCDMVSRSIQACRTTEVSVTRAIAASCIYDKNFDRCRLELIFYAFPDVLDWTVSEESNTEEENDRLFEQYKNKLVTIPGIKDRLASLFLEKWMKVKKWLDEFEPILNISYRLGAEKNNEVEQPEREGGENEENEDDDDETISNNSTTLMASTSPAFPKIWNGKFAFTGIKRNPNLLKFLIKNGAKAVDCDMSTTVTCLIVNSHDDKPSSKVKKAIKWNKPILTLPEFCRTYLQLEKTSNPPWMNQN